MYKSYFFRFSVFSILLLFTFNKVNSQNLTTVSPTANTINVALDATIVLTFDVPIDAATITVSNIVILGNAAGPIDGVFSGGGSEVITFTPTANFKPGEIITITVTTGIQTTTGGNLNDPFVSQFTSTVNPVSPGVFLNGQNTITTAADGAQSVYAADLDGDGDLDVLSASSSDDRIAWYENDGTGSFGSQQTITTATDGAQSVYAADLDGDGDLDVLSASQDDNRIAWYENDGTGSFGTQQTVTTAVDRTQSVYAADLDGDGDLDVLSASQDDNRIAWYENDGTGSFGVQQNITTEARSALSVYTADLDGDGDLDVLSASQDDDRIAWYENDGTGSFGVQQNITTEAGSAQSVYAADLDGDGDLDVLATSQDDDHIAWYENDGTGSFGTQQTITTATNITSGAYAADLDGDGDLDVLSASQDDNRIAWYENDGTGSFGTQQTITTAANAAESVYAADLDGDGDLDILSASSNDDRIAWYENRKEPTLTTLSPTSNAINVALDASIVLTFDIPIDAASLTANNIVVIGNTTGLIEGVFSGGDSEVINFTPTTDFTPGEIITVTLTTGIQATTTGDNLSTPIISQFTTAVNPASPGVFPKDQNTITIVADGAFSVYTADLDGDGDLDLLSASINDDRIAWYKNDGTGSFGTQQTITTDANGAQSVYAADLDGDGDIDVLSASSSDDRIAWYENDGTGSFGTQQTITNMADVAQNVYAADLDGDGDIDVLSASLNDDRIAWYKNDGTGSFGTQQTITTEANGGFSVYAADLDGDGDLDVLSASLLDSRIAWYENDGTGSFGTQQTITTDANGAISVYAADLDGDGDLDVLSASLNDDRIAWYENDGIGSFGTQQTITTDADGAFSVYAADLDGDGDLDVLSASSNDDRIAWYENDGTGSFGTQQTITTNANGAISVYAADLDSDGDLDVLSASSSDDRIAWYENRSAITLTTISPTQNAINVALDATIVLTFDVPIDAASLTSNNIVVLGNATGPIEGVFSGGGTQVINFTPTTNFTPGEIITVTLTTAIQTTTGGDLSTPFISQFTTTVNPTSPGVFLKGQNTITTAVAEAFSVYAADLDGDGDLDLLSASEGDDRITWYENDGTGSFGPRQTITTEADETQSVYAADLDGDGDLDVLSTSSGDDRIAWYENDGTGSFGVQQTITTDANEARSVYAADLDGDGDLDVLSASSNDDRIAWYENDGTGSFGTQQTITTSADSAASVYAADLDGDGDIDVLSASINDDRIAWYENDGTGFFGAQQNITTDANGAQSVYAADLDGDGDLDVLSASTNDDRIAWYENDGTGSFGVQQNITTAADEARSVYAVDLDGDGDLDILSASSNDDRIAWYENDGTGFFGPQQTITNVADGAQSVYAADLDGDGDLDVLSASPDDNRIAWYENADINANWLGLTSDWNTTTNWSNGAVPIATDEVNIPSGTPNDPLISGNTGAVALNLTVASGATLTISSGSSLLISGTSSGSIVYTRTLTADVDPTKAWHLVSSPVSELTVQTFISENTLASGTTNPDFRGIANYKNDGTSWNYYLASYLGADNFNAGKGYAIKNAAAGDISFTGTYTSGDQNYTISQATNNYNLVGNPFSAYINLGAFFTDNDAVNRLSEPTIWLWDPSANSGTGAYIQKMSGTDATFEIAPGQAFFVSAGSAASNKVTFTSANQSHQTDSFLRSSTSRTEIKLNVSQNDITHQTKIYYIEGTTTGFDKGFDGSLFGGVSYNLAVYSELISTNDNRKIGIQSLPNSGFENMVVPIGLKALANQEITFSSETLNLPTGIHVYLEDKINNNFTNISESGSTYKVTLPEDIAGTGRFYIHTKENVLSVDTTDFIDISMYKPDLNTLRITGLQNGSVYISLYTILGKNVMSSIFKAKGINDIELPKLSSGIYIVKLQTGKVVISKKIILE